MRKVVKIKKQKKNEAKMNGEWEWKLIGLRDSKKYMEESTLYITVMN